MKIMVTLLILLVLFLPTAPAQDDMQLNLPEGAVARLGKGKVSEVQYSPDGSRLAVVSSIGIWLYDTTTYRAIALIGGDRREAHSVVFSPDGTTLAGVSWGKTVRLWDVKTSEQKRVFTGHTERINDLAFSPDGKLLASASYDGTMLLWEVH